VIAAALVAGCATAPADAGFSDVNAAAEERTGYSLAWTRGVEEDRRVAEVVAGLLGDELTIEEAVQVALLSNRNIQATYEELGIRRGALIQAGLPENPVLGADFRFFDAGLVVEGAFVEDLISVFTIPLRRRMEANHFEAAKLRVTNEVVTLVAEAKRAYIDYQASKQLVELLQQVVQATKASYMAQERLREAGNTRQFDVLQERAFYEESKVALNQAIEALVLARERMNAVMGLWGEQTRWETPARLPELPAAVTASLGDQERGEPTPPPATRATTAEGEPGQRGPGETQEEFQAERLAGPPTNEQLTAPTTDVLGEIEAAPGPGAEAEILDSGPGPSSERFAEVERLAVQRNLHLAATRDEIEAQAARLKLEMITAAFPFLDAGVTFERNPAGNEEEWGLGPAVRSPIPIFDWGQAQYPQEASRLRQRLEHYAQDATSVRALARVLETRLQTSRARATYQREVVMPLHAALVQEAQLQYNAMQLTPFQLLLVKEQQIQAAITYVTALHAYWRARADLEQLLDGGLPATVPIPVAGGIGAPAGAGAFPGMGGGRLGMMGGGNQQQQQRQRQGR
jgi:cobalt-zinc-cadmium efflux system outer membrane protein